ncbi:MAG: RAMP superfamily protein [Microcoleus sp.]
MMVSIPDAANLVPLMFQAQAKGRSQLQYIDKDKEPQEQDSYKWAAQWTDKAYPNPPDFGDAASTKTYEMQWRFVTNGGQFEGIIFPALGAFGLPFYPGSSMKGVFCQACTEEQKQRYRLTKNGDEPSLLRFHGGYPINDWKQNLVDIVHPQQKWQVKTHDTDDKPKGETGFALISLLQPTIKFGISSLLPETDWEEVWAIWERALGYGIGCRTSSGYGMPKQRLRESGEVDCPIPIQGEVLYKAWLKGQGQAPTLIDKTAEFRPNIFRGSLRGHALRIFGGLTNSDMADKLVENLFGGVEDGGTQGLLSCVFEASSFTSGRFTVGYGEPTYNVVGELRWLLMAPRQLDETNQEVLKKLLRLLMQFTMLFGGFGKSWRRSDHRLFYEEYYQGNSSKPLIGCHWRWDNRSLGNAAKVRNLNQVAPFLNEVRQIASEWMHLNGVEPDESQYSDWREAWHPENVQIFGRLADGADSEAIKWLHQPYQRANQQFKEVEKSIKKSDLAGKISQIGRLWHRMYPVVILVDNPNNPGRRVPRATDNYLEILTIFPDDSLNCEDFLKFLQSEPGGFKRLWPQ